MAQEWTADDLARIDTAIASNAAEVRFADRSIRYRSIDELKKARTEIQLYLAAQNQQPVRQLRIFTDKGFGG